MNTRKLVLENKSDIEFVEKLYIESFPPNERRSVSKMHNLIEQNELFDVFLLFEDNLRVGFFSLWTFDSFIYLEHFAILPEYRNGGYGKKSVHLIINETKLPLIGEIELPSASEIASRRLAFYERLGFKIWDISYVQPPYEEGFDPVPMKLISYRDIDLNQKQNEVKTLLYANVYQWENV